MLIVIVTASTQVDGIQIFKTARKNVNGIRQNFCAMHVQAAKAFRNHCSESHIMVMFWRFNPDTALNTPRPTQFNSIHYINLIGVFLKSAKSMQLLCKHCFETVHCMCIDTTIGSKSGFSLNFLTLIILFHNFAPL